MKQRKRRERLKKIALVVSSIDAAERFPVALRAYVPSASADDKTNSSPKKDAGPSEWALVFDTETTTDPSQRLRFGSYQVRRNDTLDEKGLFFDPDVLTRVERGLLQQYAKAKGFKLRTLTEFIDEIFFDVGYDRRANIIGFNLPFDISRLAHQHDSARNWRGRGMRGGFTFKLSYKHWRPKIQIRHHNRSLAFIRFAASPEQLASRSGRKRGQRHVRRGYFLDLRTTAAALTSRLHSLDSLAEFLNAPHRKLKTDEHGKRLTTRYIDYAVNDVETTWACFVGLRERYEAHKLHRTGLNKIYSEAGLGKAYLNEMGITPWRKMQPNFPPELIGKIITTYYGGRAEVHLRRIISQVLYCDFTSMYPTVCSLMRLWDFVIAREMSWHDSTAETQKLLDGIESSDLQAPAFWQQLRTIVQVQPDADIFPVRARYAKQSQFTIGLNYLSSDYPMWFTLADCIASKLLTGKTPRVLHAWTFKPGLPQPNLWPVNIMGRPKYRIDPRRDDFYRRLIELRMEVQGNARQANEAEAARLDTEQLALKILANATSYGIFVELNVDELAQKQTRQRYGASDRVEGVSCEKVEEPGQYFHPLLGTLITGAARLMLAIVETKATQSKLDWAFCDTDSMALAKPAGMSDAEFFSRGQAICSWFKPLNPYSNDVEIFKVEDQNRGIEKGKLTDDFEPLFCYAVSAKRYALFNITNRNTPLLRKVSAHGLGHWLPPYDDKKAPRAFPKPAVDLEDVKRWQHDLWYRIVASALTKSDTTTNPAAHRSFDRPIASQYHATKPFILNWFKTYNTSRPSKQQVRPFNFLLSFQIRAFAEPVGDALGVKRRKQLSKLRPVAPYDSDPRKAIMQYFDRDTGKRIKVDDLETYREALAQYHMYPENKFLNGQYRDSGPTQRRHVKVELTDVHYIGKEANELDEQVFFGFDPEAQPEYGMESEAYAKLLEKVRTFLKAHRLSAVSSATGISKRYLRVVRDGQPNVSPEILIRIERALPVIEAADAAEREREQQLLDWVRGERDRIGLNKLAGKLRIDPANLQKVLSRNRSMSQSLRKVINRKRMGL